MRQLLSPSYGIYSGYELCENQAVPGTEEYLNSEKYEIKVRDWNQPGNIKEFIGRVNSIRRENRDCNSSSIYAVSNHRQRSNPVLLESDAG